MIALYIFTIEEGAHIIIGPHFKIPSFQGKRQFCGDKLDPVLLDVPNLGAHLDRN
jgi:hypothetical protein